MLIIAIPKSASSSLLKTISELHDIQGVQDFSFSQNEKPKGCQRIHITHSDIRELNGDNVEKFYSDEKLYKQHIFPSKNNLKLLQHKKKVILLRNPEDILKAYLRGAKYNFNSLPTGYDLKMSNKEVIKKAKSDGFHADLCFFYNEWVSKASDQNTLFVYYREYIRDTKTVINKLEEFFGLPITSKAIKPIKARYSQISFYKKFKSSLKKYLLLILKRMGIKVIFL